MKLTTKREGKSTHVKSPANASASSHREGATILTASFDQTEMALLMRRQMRAQRHKIESAKRIKTSRRRRFPSALPIPGWGKRRMTKADFNQTCEREGILVLRLPLSSMGIRGACGRLQGIPFIWIDSRLRGIERLRTEFHELGHYFFHDGNSLPVMFDEKKKKKTRERYEFEANAVARLALAPVTTKQKR
jgi:Zn-dependent peptidase ImmA (M78 family)